MGKTIGTNVKGQWKDIQLRGRSPGGHGNTTINESKNLKQIGRMELDTKGSNIIEKN